MLSSMVLTLLGLPGLLGFACTSQVMGSNSRFDQMLRPTVQTKGVVLTPDDLTLPDWPARAAGAGLTTIALHPSPSIVQQFIRSDSGVQFLSECRRLGVQVEYELHAMAELLPRSLFQTEPTLFRMDEHGNRTADSNLCVHS